jgi:hypothetical protein
MPSYLVSYDLRKLRNYDALYDRLKLLPGAWKPLESVWIIPEFSSSRALRLHIDPALDTDDGLIVLELGPDQSFRNPDSAPFGFGLAGLIQLNALSTSGGFGLDPKREIANALMARYPKTGL